jgi:PAS domain S-box-containing protein
MLRRQARSAYQIAAGPSRWGVDKGMQPMSGVQAERALHQSQWLLRLLVEHTSAAVAMFDSRMRFMLVSRRFLSDYGLHGRDLVGVSYYDVFPETTSEIRRAHQRCLEGLVERRAEDPFRRQDGRVEWLRWEMHPWRHTNGEIGGQLLFTEHITEQKEARERLKLFADELAGKNQQLMEALDKAEMANKSKNMFVASMSHEVRTPLNAIIGYAEMLEEDARESDQQEIAADLLKILAAGKRLLTLTDDVLDLAHLEAGTAQLAPETFEIADLVDEVVDSVRPLAESRGDEIEIRGLEGAGTMHADITKVRQCMFTLLVNACKFTQRGMIVVTIEDEWGKKREGDRVRIMVEDTGGAVDPDRVAALFDPYASPDDPSGGVPPDGTGFGLAIIRRFMELLGGELFAETLLGAGSKFTMVLPRYRERRAFATSRE